ncbi:MAG: hypothetical protein MRZ79_17670 [Bacteroidia bacterium]|nr:hypothetical protein [Bacteroidia bacterium]
MIKSVHDIFLQALLANPHLEDNTLKNGIPSLGKGYADLVKRASSVISNEKKGNLPKRIPHPFSFVDQHYNESPPEALSPGKLSIDGSYLFPGANRNSSVSDLLDKFSQRLKALDVSHWDAPSYEAQESLLSLSQYYTGTIPLGNTGIALFDHARLTAALAICLHHNQEAGLEGEAAELTFLVKGDLSGIQSYIFDVASRGAARALKGRSLRVQIINYLASRFFLENLNLSPANLLFIGGGNFFLLIPGSAKNEFEGLKKQLSEEILKKSQDNKLDFNIPEKLHLYLGMTDVKLEDFKAFGEKWQEADEAVNEERGKRYKEAGHQLIFAPINEMNQDSRREFENAFFKDRTKKLTEATGWEMGNTPSGWIETVKQKIIREENTQKRIDSRTIPNPYSLSGSKVEFRVNKGSNLFVEALETHGRLEFESDSPKLPPSITSLVKKMPTWNSGSMERWSNLIEVLREEENEVELEDGDILSFTALGLKAKARTGTARLGILKMDIDHLGKLFQKRLKEDCRSIAHTSAISRALKWFFEGYLNQLLDRPLSSLYQEAYMEKQHNKLSIYEGETLGDNLYVIFSGGDDFFVVGAWDMVMEFALIMKEEFDAFTGGAAGLSAGLVMVSRKHPVSRFSDMVEAAEGKAKNYSSLLGEIFAQKEKDGKLYYPKGRISVFGEVLSWRDYKEAMDLRNLLFFLINKDDKPESRAVIQKIRNYMNGFGEIQRNILLSKVLDYKAMWRLAYYLRDVKKENKPFIQKDVLDRHRILLNETLHTFENDKIKIPANPALIGVAARWAEMMIRVDNNKSKLTK